MTTTGDRAIVIASAELGEGEMRHVDVPGSEWGALVARVDGVVYAVEDHCSHQDVLLSEEGELLPDVCRVECLLHGSAFSLRTGHPDVMPATRPIPTYAVREADGRILIDPESTPHG